MDREQAINEVDFYTQEISRLKRGDINEIRSLASPPELVKASMGAVCILFGHKEDWKSS